MIREVVNYDKINDTFNFDFNSTNLNDIVNVAEAGVYTSNIGGDTYWFGYKFNQNIDSSIRTKFIHWIKGLITEDRPKTSELFKFIDRPIAKLNSKLPLVTFDALVYPRSNRSELVNRMIDVIHNYIDRSAKRADYELIKNLPSSISFDFEAFKDSAKSDNQIKQVYDYVNNELLPKIHSLDYFSIAQNVKPKYRKYITDFLKFSSEESKNTFRALCQPQILVVDDINTSGATLTEIIRIIKKVNPTASVFIFTLLGKEFDS